MSRTERRWRTPSGSAPLRRWLSLRVYLIPLVLLLAVTLPHLDQGDWRTDTGRYAAIGLQAWADGLFWTLRTHPDHPWFNKPPLAIWIHGLGLHVLGASLVVARLPSVVAAAGSVLATVWLVRAFHGRGVALATGFVLALTYEFFRRTREVSLDMWQLMFLLLALAMLARAATRDRPAPWSLAGGAMLGLALMCKPLVALAALPIVGAWMLIAGRASRLWTLAVALGSAAVVAGPWHVSMAWLHGPVFVDQYLGAEVIDRAAGEIRTYPLWYYASQISRTYWPWLAFFAIGLWPAIRGRLGRSGSGPRLALVWLAAWFVLLSVFPDKAPRYGLVLYPALAWVVGGVLAARNSGALRRARRRSLVPFTIIACTGSGVFAVLPVRVQRPPEPEWVELFETLDELGHTPVF